MAFVARFGHHQSNLGNGWIVRNEQILTINGGSSSIKFAVFQPSSTPRRVLRGQIERIGLPQSMLRVESERVGESCSRAVSAPDHHAAVQVLMDWIEDVIGIDKLRAVGHRVVHGGPRHFQPERITPELVEDLRRLTPFDPQHLPEEILLTNAFYRRFPQLEQVACFDTGFHQGLPAVAQLVPLPRRFYEKGVRRYGFHGLSYQYLLEELTRLAGAQVAAGRLILAHLGNGASLAAVRDGRSVDTSMAFTPAAGIPMSTRSGDLDPGLTWFLLKAEGLDVNQFNHMVNFESGLLGISETSADMRDLRQRAATDPRAAQAIDVFCYHVRKCIGAFAAALGGLDTVVFSGGIGEHDAQVRAGVLEGLEFLGILLDPSANGSNAPIITAPDSKVVVRVIATDEELMIAQAVFRLLTVSDHEKTH